MLSPCFFLGGACWNLLSRFAGPQTPLLPPALSQHSQMHGASVQSESASEFFFRLVNPPALRSAGDARASRLLLLPAPCRPCRRAVCRLHWPRQRRGMPQLHRRCRRCRRGFPCRFRPDVADGRSLARRWCKQARVRERPPGAPSSGAVRSAARGSRLVCVCVCVCGKGGGLQCGRPSRKAVASYGIPAQTFDCPGHSWAPASPSAFM